MQLGHGNTTRLRMWSRFYLMKAVAVLRKKEKEEVEHTQVCNVFRE